MAPQMDMWWCWSVWHVTCNRHFQYASIGRQKKRRLCEATDPVDLKNCGNIFDSSKTVGAQSCLFSPVKISTLSIMILIVWLHLHSVRFCTHEHYFLFASIELKVCRNLLNVQMPNRNRFPPESHCLLCHCEAFFSLCTTRLLFVYKILMRAINY